MTDVVRAIGMAWFTGVLMALLAAIGALLVASRLRKRRTASQVAARR